MRIKRKLINSFNSLNHSQIKIKNDLRFYINLLKNIMGKLKRCGYIFITWKGDHEPKHVHIIRNGKKICKWDLDNNQVMEGKINRKMLKALQELIKEKKLK